MQVGSALPESEQPGEWPWAKVLAYFAANHKQGEHVAFEGPTGSGKSTLALELLIERGNRRAADRRPTRVTILETKRRDRTMNALQGLGWKRITRLDEWPPAYGDEHTIVWPPAARASVKVNPQKPLFVAVLDEVEESGNQILYLDEVADFTDSERDGGFGLGGTLSIYWRRSRSNGVSLFAATQRPVAVPRLMWDSSSWMFLFRPEDLDDLKRIAEISGCRELVLEVVPTLEQHEFLMIRRRPVRLAIISRVEL